MTQPTTNTSNNTLGLTYGLIGGLSISVFTLLLYVGGLKYYVSGLAFIPFFIVGTLAVLAGLQLKKQSGGYLSTAEALKVVFTVFVLSFLLQLLFNYILLNYIDIPFRDAVTQYTVDKAEQVMKRFGAPDSDIEKMRVSASDPKNYSLGRLLLSYSMWCILYFIISVIIALIIRKKRPPFENSFNQ